MKFWTFTWAFSLVMIAAAAAQTTQNAPNAAATPSSTNSTVNPQSKLLRILTPVERQQLSANVLDVRFELVNPMAAGSPSFQIQLDGEDPISTTATQYTFTSLSPGTHSVTVALVDANGTPIHGGRAVVQFGVPQQQLLNPTKQETISNAVPPLTQVRSGTETDGGLPGSNSALPLISVIGFGVLISGVATAMKTR